MFVEATGPQIITPPPTQAIVSHLHPAVSWNIEEHPLPTGREEVWRFTPIKQLTCLFSGQEAASQLSWRQQLPPEISASLLDLDEARRRSIEPGADRPGALAHACAGQAKLFEVPAHTELNEPVVFTLTGAGDHELAYDHVIFDVGEQAHVQVVLRFEGNTQLASKFDVRVGDGAQVDFVMVHDWAPEAIEATQVSVLVGRDAHVRTVQASLGGALVRVVERASFAAPGGRLEQFGLYFVESGQHIEHRLFVDHDQPQTISNVDYRGALQGKNARSVWVGDVLIRKNALHITTYEANKNLLLTDGCRAESVPNLEIETGDIEGAGHSSTTGRFDDEQLFYLRSRGIPEPEARRLVVQGFFGDIIRRIGVPVIEERLNAAVERELAAMTKVNL